MANTQLALPPDIRKHTRFGPTTTTETDSTSGGLPLDPSPQTPAQTSVGTSNDSFARWSKTQSPDDLRRVIDDLGPAIDSGLQYHLRGNVTPIIRDRARIAAAKAVRNFDPRQGADLKTYVRNAMQAFTKDAPKITDPMPVPARLRQQRAEVFAGMQKLKDELRRDPTDEELSEALHLTPAKFRKLKPLLRHQQPLSALDQDDDDGDSQDVVASTRTDYDDWVEAIYHDLPPTDQLILQHRTGLNGAEKLDAPELAKVTGLSIPQINHRIRRLQQRLNEFGA